MVCMGSQRRFLKRPRRKRKGIEKETVAPGYQTGQKGGRIRGKSDTTSRTLNRADDFRPGISNSTLAQ